MSDSEISDGGISGGSIGGIGFDYTKIPVSMSMASSSSDGEFPHESSNNVIIHRIGNVSFRRATPLHINDHQ